MFTYTIAGTTYYCAGNRLLITADEEHELSEVDDHSVYLYEHEDWGEAVPCRLDWGGEIYDRVKAVPLVEHLTRHIPVDDFDSATAMRTVVPDGIHECPECGSWAGPIDEEPECFSCGYGLSDDESNERSVA